MDRLVKRPSMVVVSCELTVTPIPNQLALLITAPPDNFNIVEISSVFDISNLSKRNVVERWRYKNDFY